MSQQTHSRRGVLKMGAGLVSLATLAGCSDQSGDDSQSSTGTLASVPAGVNVVATLDFQRLLDDDLLRQRFEEAASSSGQMSGGGSIEDALDQVEQSLGLDPRSISEAVVAAEIANGTENIAVIVDTDWTESAVESAILDGSPSGESTTYEGQAIYQSQESAVGVLPSGKYVLSTPEYARDVIDVAQGSAESVSGNITDGFNAASDGYMRLAFELPSGATSQGSMSPLLTEIEYGYGGAYRDGDTRGGELVLEMTSSDAATQFASSAEQGLSVLASEITSGSQNEELAADMMSVIEATTVEQNGSTVTIENTDGQGLLPLIPAAVVASFVLGLGEQGTAPPPRANFSFDYDGSELTITHTAGDRIPSSELYVRGDGVSPTGRWDEIADGSSSGPRVMAGDSITLDADPDYEVSLVWKSSDRGTSSVFASDEGPEA